MLQDTSRARASRAALAAACAFFAVTPSSAAAQQVVEERISTEYQDIRLVRVAGDLRHPWAVAPLPDGRLLVSERGGRLLLVDAASSAEVTGLPDVHAQNQGGLLDVVVHPDYATNGWIYMTYSHGDSTGTVTALTRARLAGNALADVEQLFRANNPEEPGMHYGSRIAFLDDGTLLMSVGDRFHTPERAQDTRDHSGSILRLHDDGSVPPDNPFVADAAFAPEIYSYGHRNIQALTRHPETGEVWAFEHGPRGSDLLHRIEAGRNYGWPEVTPGRHYDSQEPFSDVRDSPAAADPVHEFVVTVAPSGLATVHGPAWDETWQGNLLAGGLRSERLLRLVVENGALVHAEELLVGEIGRIRDVRQGTDGFVYLVTDEEDGGVYRLEPVDTPDDG
jgi:aldose sugar dehydrogenase